MSRTARPSPGQLDAGLATGLPLLQLPPEWKAQQRLWGHSFHPMCSYLAMFPAGLAHAFVARYSRPGDVVFDPFSGRGTTPLQACAEGRVGAGNDLNPLAYLLTAAKVDPPSRAELAARLSILQVLWASEGPAWIDVTRAAQRTAANAGAMRAPARPAQRATSGSGGAARSPRHVPHEDVAADAAGGSSLPRVPAARGGLASASALDRQAAARHAVGRWPIGGASGLSPGSSGDAAEEALPPEVGVCFHERTLAQLLMVRHELDLSDRVDRFLAAAITGILHGKTPTYLSTIMPNTFSMAPRYVREFAARTGFRPEQRDLFDLLEVKLKRLFRQPPPPARGLALLGDARNGGSRLTAALRERSLPGRARLVVTSPPYLRVVKYGAYNWLRLWFLGVDAGGIDTALDDAHHLPAYLAFMRGVLADLRSVLTDDAVVALVIGDVELDRGRRITNGVGLAESVWEASARPEGYALAGITFDHIAAHRKTTRIWGDEAGRATKVDRLLVLAPTELGRRRAISGARTPIDWTWPPRGPRLL